MPQFTRFMPLPTGPARVAVERVIRGLRETPPTGEAFRDFRSRLKRLDIYSRERMPDILAFLRLADGDHIHPGPVLGAVIAATEVEAAADVLADRLFAVNPILFKAVIERMQERVNGKSELRKYLDSFAYPGTPLSGPETLTWLDWAVGLDLLKPLGVGLTLGERGERYVRRAAEIDVDEYLDEDEPEAPLVPVGAPTDAAGSPAGAAVAGMAPGASSVEVVAPSHTANVAPRAAASTGLVPAASGAPQTRSPSANAAAPSAKTNPVAADLVGLTLDQAPAPRLPDPPVDEAALVIDPETGAFSDEIRGANARWLDGWWRAARGDTPAALWKQLGFGGEAWQEDPEGALYGLAVAAALRANAEGDDTSREAEAAHKHQVLAAAGLLDALQQGAALKGALPAIDPNALLSASLVARRMAECPDLVGDLERCADADAAYARLEASFGRGLLDEPGLSWLLGALGRSGVLRLPGIDRRLAVDDRGARDVLFRLGALPSPYAPDEASLLRASQVARHLVPGADQPEQALRAFALAAGCAYGCPHRAACAVGCRERTEGRS